MNRRTFLFGALSTAAAILVPNPLAKKIFLPPEKKLATLTVVPFYGRSVAGVQAISFMLVDEDGKMWEFYNKNGERRARIIPETRTILSDRGNA